jgi:AGZA family xanthine/uracil permease-like MFS transporter
LIKAGVRAGGGDFDQALVGKLQQADIWVEGAFALEQGFIFSAMILSAVVVFIIEGRFRRAAGRCLAGATLTYLGLMHSWKFTQADTALDLSIGAAGDMALGYLAIAALLWSAPWLTEPSDSHV